MAKILLVEDDEPLAASVEGWLTKQMHTVEWVSDGSEALYRLKSFPYELVILDWEIPGLSGLDVCRQYRAQGGSVPILMLTGKSEWQEKTTGLDSGADDYLTKPFHIEELGARLRALLRRTGPVVNETMSVRGLVLDSASRRVTKEGKEVKLLPREFALLEFFMRHPNQVFDLNALLNNVWPADCETTPESLRPHIMRLRSKIDNEDNPLIRTVHGMGYRFEP